MLNQLGEYSLLYRYKWARFPPIWQADFQFRLLLLYCSGTALLHKSRDGRISPFPGQTHPTASVTGMPSAV